MTAPIIFAGSVANEKSNFREIMPNAGPLDSYGLWIWMSDAFGTNAFRNILIDVAIGPPGEEVIIIPNLSFSGMNTIANSYIGTFQWFSGLFIPANSRIVARMQCTTASHQSRIGIFLDHSLRVGVLETTVLTYGADTANSRGTSTPMANGSFGAWTEIGTTTRAHKVFCVAIDSLGDIALVAGQAIIEIGFGPDSGSVQTIGKTWCNHSGTEQSNGYFPPVQYCPVPSGSILWARIAGPENANYGICIYGI